MFFCPYAIGLEACRRAAAKGIELRPWPHALSEEFMPYVSTSDPKGHYFGFRDDGVEIITMDDFRSAGGTYTDLIPKYKLVEIVILPFNDQIPLDDPKRRHKVVAIRYKPIAAPVDFRVVEGAAP